MRTTIHLGFCLLAALAAGCSGGGTQRDAAKTAAALTGEDAIPAATNPQCKLFTPSELRVYVGAAVGAGHDAAMGTGCQWTGDGEASAMIQVVPARYHEPHRGAAGFRKVGEADAGGAQGFVEQSLGGWNAGAVTGPEAVVVAVSGPAANDGTALALLRETVARRAKHSG